MIEEAVTGRCSSGLVAICFTLGNIVSGRRVALMTGKLSRHHKNLFLNSTSVQSSSVNDGQPLFLFIYDTTLLHVPLTLLPLYCIACTDQPLCAMSHY